MWCKFKVRPSRALFRLQSVERRQKHKKKTYFCLLLRRVRLFSRLRQWWIRRVMRVEWTWERAWANGLVKFSIIRQDKSASADPASPASRHVSFCLCFYLRQYQEQAKDHWFIIDTSSIKRVCRVVHQGDESHPIYKSPTRLRSDIMGFLQRGNIEKGVDASWV